MADQLANDLCCTSIVEVLMNKIALGISIRENDRTAERVIIASDKLVLVYWNIWLGIYFHIDTGMY